ncbi:MAG: putative ACR [Candidatus Fermentimicrarchaeum limneticum]|uniref:Protein Sv326_0203 n=1 Tax=Fermentimicrarchaeum limneticum TaxID=2795018 RepID=A0A7D6BLJ4_FERL1|nr:MAG: putative ACR [Candidatus Fermentimicrarchaeum limneticum]
MLEKRGVFVTIETYPEKGLRGCIGYPYPVKELAQSVVDCAINSATSDPRFPEMSRKELDNCTVEISVLTVPEIVKVGDTKEYPKKIKVGKDGLIVEYGYYSGLLLPIVPVEQNWDEEEFLSQTCYKAGLPLDMWLRPKVRLYRFQSQVFKEEKPKGKVVEVELGVGR